MAIVNRFRRAPVVLILYQNDTNCDDCETKMSEVLCVVKRAPFTGVAFPYFFHTVPTHERTKLSRVVMRQYW